jgi:hypothetical protein
MVDTDVLRFSGVVDTTHLFICLIESQGSPDGAMRAMLHAKTTREATPVIGASRARRVALAWPAHVQKRGTQFIEDLQESPFIGCPVPRR